MGQGQEPKWLMNGRAAFWVRAFRDVGFPAFVAGYMMYLLHQALPLAWQMQRTLQQIVEQQQVIIGLLGGGP